MRVRARALLGGLSWVPGVAAAVPLQDALHAYGIQAAHIGRLWNFTLGLCTLVFGAIFVAFLWALWRAPRGRAGETAPDMASLARPERRLHRAVGLATGIATLGLLLLLAADVFTSRALARLPLGNAVNIELIGHEWWWEARYHHADPARDFVTANELHIPVGRAVVVTLRSNDVIHTLWVPNLHGKRDMIPGRTSTLQLRADHAGTYRGQCAEFCGLEHAKMAMLVEAEPDAAYEAWAARQRQAAAPPATAQALRGRAIFETSNCASCHTVEGTAAHGKAAPDLTHLAGRTTLAAGILPNDGAHLAAWILDPQSHKQGVYMPATTIKPDDLQALVTYLGTLK